MTPPRRSPTGSPRPTARPARTVAALDKARWTMNVAEEICSAMPCAASGIAPSQPIITPLAANRLTSARLVKPIGMPSRTTSHIASQSGRHNRANRPPCFKPQIT